MLSYMVHPKHGRMPVYSETEAKYNEKSGWVSEVEKPKENIESPEDMYEKKFGKRPHHRMTQENIKKALE